MDHYEVGLMDYSSRANMKTDNVDANFTKKINELSGFRIKLDY